MDLYGEKCYYKDIKKCQGNKNNNNDKKSKLPYVTVPLVDTNCELKVPSTSKRANSKERQDNMGNDESHMIWNYTFENQKIDVLIKAQDQITCPFCFITFKNICNHLKRSRCKIPNLEHFSQALKEFKRKTFINEIKENQRQRKQKSDAKLREIDNLAFKERQSQRKAKSDAKQRAINEEKVIRDRAERRSKSNAKYRAIDEEKVKKNQTERRTKSDAKLRAIDEEKVKKDQAERKARSDAKQRAINEEKVIRDRAERRTKSYTKQRAIDEKKVKKDQTERKRLSRNKRKLENPVKLSQMELLAQIKKKKTLG